jgi:hypothetical protein
MNIFQILIKKVPPVNSEVLVRLEKNIESPATYAIKPGFKKTCLI